MAASMWERAWSAAPRKHRAGNGADDPGQAPTRRLRYAGRVIRWVLTLLAASTVACAPGPTARIDPVTASTPVALSPGPSHASQTEIAVTPASDPFEQPLRGTSPNCGPEERGRRDVALESARDFAAFVADHGRELSPWVEPAAFLGPDGQVDRAKVAAAVQTTALSGRTVFALRFRPPECGDFTLRMTNDGYWSLYGCCGK